MSCVKELPTKNVFRKTKPLLTRAARTRSAGERRKQRLVDSKGSVAAMDRRERQPGCDYA